MTKTEFKQVVEYVSKQVLQYGEESTKVVRTPTGTEDIRYIVLTKDIVKCLPITCTFEKFSEETGVKKTRKKATDVVYTPEFEEWWNLYPTGKGFEYSGVRIMATERSLRDDKEKTFKKYKEVKDVTATQLLHALEVEVTKRKIESIKSGENKFQYMKASISYLNSKRYLFYLNDEVPDAPNVSVFNGVDI